MGPDRIPIAIRERLMSGFLTLRRTDAAFLAVVLFGAFLLLVAQFV